MPCTSTFSPTPPPPQSTHRKAQRSSRVPGEGNGKPVLGWHYTLASGLHPLPLSHVEDKAKVLTHRRLGGGLAEE